MIYLKYAPLLADISDSAAKIQLIHYLNSKPSPQISHYLSNVHMQHATA